MLDIYVDADACPVKQEVCKVAKRYKLKVVFVANAWMRIPEESEARLVVVEGQFNAADDWIIEQISHNDIVITADIPLADRCIKKHARVLGHTGRRFSEDNIGQMMATRGLLSELREAGAITGGPAPFEARDRSRFLESLDQVIQDVKMQQKRGEC